MDLVSSVKIINDLNLDTNRGLGIEGQEDFKHFKNNNLNTNK